jgi:hypothetical protein
LGWANWRGTVYHGLPRGLYRFEEKPGSYLAFLGRISPEKRVDRAIEIAQRSGVKLKIAAKGFPVLCSASHLAFSETDSNDNPHTQGYQHGLSRISASIGLASGQPILSF